MVRHSCRNVAPQPPPVSAISWELCSGRRSPAAQAECAVHRARAVRFLQLCWGPDFPPGMYVMCMCMCVRTSVCSDVHVCMCLGVHVCVKFIYAYMCVCLGVYVCVFVFRFAHVQMCLGMHMHVCLGVIYVCVLECVCVFVFRYELCKYMCV